MKVLPARPVLSVAIVATLVTILVLLALLQYRWSGQVSEAGRERMQIGLDTSVNEFREDYLGDLLRVCLAFRLDPPARFRGDWKRYLGRYEAWERTALHPELVSGVFLWETQESGKLLRVDSLAQRIESVPWPPRLDPLRKRLAAQIQDARQIQGRGIRLYAWTVDENTPALLHPLLFLPLRGEPGREFPRIVGYLVIELNLDYIKATLLPGLARRHFHTPEGFVYRVEVVDNQNPSKAVYQSDPRLPQDALASADARVDLLGELPEDLFRSPVVPGTEAGERPRNGVSQRVTLRTIPAILPLGGVPRWQLVVKHRYGSLDAVVARMRRRNLAISFGVLLLLAVSMAMIILSTQRAQRLAKLQMDFVAGISHELRTPLAVICSAGENLADGVVDPKPQVKQYGELVRNEGRRLAGMVEQILVFAAGQAGRPYDVRPLEIGGIVEAVLENSVSAIRQAGFSVSKKIEPDLPAVLADELALKQCLQNLVNNALKYGAEGRWLGITARLAANSRGPVIQVAVSDKGLGIDEADLKHIFEPFYRGKAARSAQIHGTGLGLSLAKDFAEAMGGGIIAESSPGKGSVFTLHLPAAEQSHESTHTAG